MADLPRLRIGTDEELNSVYIKKRYRGTMIAGKSGGGKTTLMLTMMMTDFLYKNALIFIDPSGVSAKDVYSAFRGQAEYLSVDNPISLNFMDQPYHPSQIIDTFISTINHLIFMSGEGAVKNLTPNMISVIQQDLPWCLENNRKNLIHLMDRIIIGKDHREARDGIVSRIKTVIGDERVQEILCRPNPVEWGEFIRNRRRMIIDTSQLSTDKSAFIGTIVMMGLVNYFKYQKPKEYQPISAYVDECHNFLAPQVATLLKEGRKFKIDLTLATQDFAYFDQRMLRVVLNSGNIISMRLGAREAMFAAPEFGMKLPDIQFLEPYTAAYLTPDGKGICKLPRPPILKNLEPKIKQEKPKPKSLDQAIRWFEIRPSLP